MTDIVPAEDIQRIVGTYRREHLHVARAVSADQRVYILHSKACLSIRPDLRECPWSLALDEGIDLDEWVEDVPLTVGIKDGRLRPLDEQRHRDAPTSAANCDYPAGSS